MGFSQAGFLSLGSDLFSKIRGEVVPNARPASPSGASLDIASKIRELFRPVTDPRAQAGARIIDAIGKAGAGIIDAAANKAKTIIETANTKGGQQQANIPRADTGGMFPSQLQDIARFFANLPDAKGGDIGDLQSFKEDVVRQTQTNVIVIGGVALALALLVTTSKARA